MWILLVVAMAERKKRITSVTMKKLSSFFLSQATTDFYGFAYVVDAAAAATACCEGSSRQKDYG